MKITLNRKLIKLLLARIDNIKKQDKTETMLDYILIKIFKYKIFAIALETDIEIITYEKIDLNIKIEFFIKYTILKNICKINNEDIEFNLSRQYINVKSGTDKFKLLNMKTKLFPTLNKMFNSETSFFIKTLTLKILLQTSTLALERAHEKNLLSGVLLNVNKKKIIALSSDKSRMVFAYDTCNNINKAGKYVLKKKTIKFFINLFTNNSYTKVNIAKDKIQFITEKIMLTSRLIKDTYLFPSVKIDIYKIIKINSLKIKLALQKIAIISANKNKIILTFLNKRIKIETQDQKESASSEILSAYSGEEIQVSLNFKHLYDIINFINSENFKLIITKNIKQVLIEELNKKYFYLIMPYKI